VITMPKRVITMGRNAHSEVGGSVRPRLPAACGCLRRTRRGQDSAVVTHQSMGQDVSRIRSAIETWQRR
jgi:hypothetical protein